MLCFNKFKDRVLQSISSIISGGFYYNLDPPVPPEITINKFIVNNEYFTFSETGQELPELFPVYKNFGVSMNDN